MRKGIESGIEEERYCQNRKYRWDGEEIATNRLLYNLLQIDTKF